MKLVPIALIMDKVSRNVINTILHNAGVDLKTPSIPSNIYFSTDKSWDINMDALVGRNSVMCQVMIDGVLKIIRHSHDIRTLDDIDINPKLVVYKIDGNVIIWHHVMCSLVDIVYGSYDKTLETITNIVDCSLSLEDKRKLLCNNWGGVWTTLTFENNSPINYVGVHSRVKNMYTTSIIVRKALDIKQLETINLSFDTPALDRLFYIT